MSSLIVGHTNSWSFAVDAEPTQLVADGSITAWLSGLTSNDFLAAVYSQYTVEQVEYRDATTALIDTIGLAGTGSAANLMPPQVSALIRKNSSLIGRANRGRMYWPGVLAEADVDNAGSVVGATVTSLQGRADELQSLIEGDSHLMVILHADGSTPTTVSSLVCEPVSATQRRRLR